MDTEVILPSFDVEQEKPLEVVEQENEQQVAERLLTQEIKSAQFPMLREHFEKIIEDYGDITILAGLPSEDFVLTVKTKAAIVSELRELLRFIDQLTQVQEDGK